MPSPSAPCAARIAAISLADPTGEGVDLAGQGVDLVEHHPGQLGVHARRQA